jgi:MFS family permease
MLIGSGTLVLGVVLTLLSIGSGSGGALSVTGFFVGTAIAGFGFGSGFQGGIRMVVPLVEPHERAGVLSLLYVVCYVGLAVPAVIAGVLVVHGGGLLPTAREYGIAIVVLALVALTGLLISGRRARHVTVLRPETDSVPGPADVTETVPQPYDNELAVSDQLCPSDRIGVGHQLGVGDQSVDRGRLGVGEQFADKGKLCVGDEVCVSMDRSV